MQMSLSTIVTWAVVVLPSAHATIPDVMTSFMNKNVKACDDFYEYACGNWIKTHPLQESDVKLESAFSLIDAKNELLFKEITGMKNTLVGRFWDSCIAYRHIDFPLRDDVHPILSATTIEKVMELTGEYSSMGTQAFTALHVEPDSNDATINTIYLSPAVLPGMDFFYDEFDAFAPKYRNYIDEFLRAAKIDVTKVRRARKPADVVIEMELEIAMIKKRNHGPTRQMSIAKAMDKWPYMVGRFLKGVGIHTNTNRAIYIEKSYYFDAMENFVKASFLKDLKLYLIFMTLHSRVDWSNEKYYLAWFKLFGKKMTQDEQPQSREAFCMSSLIRYMPDLFGKYYIKSVWNQNQEQDALIMIKSIKQAMRQHIGESKWMEEKAQIEAQAKLDNMLVLVGKSSVSQSYPSSLSHFDYRDNVKYIVLDSFDAKIKKVGQPVNREEWIESPAIANAFYSLRENRLVLPAAILQPPLFYGEKVHPARNFGAIGTIIGHEMTHAFDIKGHMFDRHGNVRDWWSEGTIREFKTLADQMISHYANYKVFGKHGYLGNVHGGMTLVENIADHGGLALAWTAYRKYIQQQVTNVTDKDGDQMFFLSFAQTWCINTREESMSKLLVTDERTPGRMRVNGAVMNNVDFAKTFQCKSGDPMNPMTKIKVW